MKELNKDFSDYKPSILRLKQAMRAIGFRRLNEIKNVFSRIGIASSSQIEM